MGQNSNLQSSTLQSTSELVTTKYVYMHFSDIPLIWKFFYHILLLYKGCHHQCDVTLLRKYVFEKIADCFSAQVDKSP